MAKANPVRARALAPIRLPVAGRRVGRAAEAGPRSPKPARSVPSELAALVAEIQRLEGELAAARDKMKELEATADIDAVTEIFNRRGFDRELKRTLAYVKRYGTPAALFYIDLDGFKPVNDRYGHAAGDAVLKAVAARLICAVRAADTVARLGGDEFGLILWNLAERDAAAKASALESAISGARIEWDGQVLAVGASIGFAMIGPEDELSDVMARADHAMYARKAQRKGNRLPQIR